MPLGRYGTFFTSLNLRTGAFTLYLVPSARYFGQVGPLHRYGRRTAR